MPVGTLGPMAVMADASPQTSRAERAVDIQVVSGAQAQGAQSADADGASAGAAEHQEVSAGDGRGAWHHSATGGSTSPLQAIAAD
jgi:hypothetical protein